MIIVVVIIEPLYLFGFTLSIVFVVLFLWFGGLSGLGVYMAINFVTMGLLMAKFGEESGLMMSKADILLGSVISLPTVLIVFLETRRAIKIYDKLREKGVNLDEVEKKLKEVDERIDFYYDGSVFIVEAPEGVDDRKILSMIPNDLDVKIVRS